MKDTQTGDLFRPKYPNVPGFKRAGTSSDAARSMEPRAPTLRGRCLALIRERPRTADECAAALGETVLAVRPRITELFKKGLIFETAERRMNESGRLAAVWRAI